MHVPMVTEYSPMSQDVTKATAARKQKKKKTDASRKEGLKDLHIPVPLQEMLPDHPTERAAVLAALLGQVLSEPLGVRWLSAISDLCDRIRSDRIEAAHLITAHTDQRNQTVAPAAGTIPPRTANAHFPRLHSLHRIAKPSSCMDANASVLYAAGHCRSAVSHGRASAPHRVACVSGGVCSRRSNIWTRASPHRPIVKFISMFMMTRRM